MFNTQQSSYESLRSIAAERTNGIIWWIGSGLSRPAGLPTWPELKEALCISLEEKARTLDPSEQDTLKKQLDAIRAQANMWIAFKILRQELGPATYTAVIRNKLKNANSAAVPAVYEQLWSLKPSGIISLNLDSLAARSHSRRSPDSAINTTVGNRINSSLHFLKSPHQFLVYLHGTAEERDSWIFTYDELSRLLKTPGYKEFIVSCFASRTIVFIGISADDQAAGGHLASLSEKHIDAGQHFWITDRKDRDTDQWAEAAGIQVIRYSTSKGSHDEQLTELFDDLASYIPQEQDVNPVFSATAKASTEKRLTSAKLLLLDHEAARTHLNNYAKAIFGDPKSTSVYFTYERFCKEYEAAIHHAWFVSVTEPNNLLCGFRLQGEVAEGAFGIVYRAKRDDDTDVAIKVLHERVRKQPEMLQSFRRGIKAMEILAKYNIAGMIQYIDASEIPAFVVMEFVEGPNLAEAVRRHRVDDWGTVLWIAGELVRIVRESHKLPERVLHRDIKPSNIMIKDGWNDDRQDWQIVVLDFDLSWHKDATEASVLHFASASGFLAPEQVRHTSSAATRSAAVDSFGIGMTLYFLRTAEEPFPSQHQHRNWTSDLEAHAKRFVDNKWKSLSRRFFRLIKAATQHEQAMRWDVSQIEGELLRLSEAYKTPDTVKSAELWAEELAARVCRVGYEWDDNRSKAVLSFPSNLSVELLGSESSQEVSCLLRWVDDGSSKHAKVTQRLSHK